MKRAILLSIVLLVFFAAFSMAFAGNKVTGIYSDMRGENGDVNGVEMFVVFSNHGYHVIFQDAEGSPRVPIVVAAKIENGRIEFELPERDGYSGKFVGTITNTAIKGKFANGQESASGKKFFVLTKGRSYWQ